VGCFCGKANKYSNVPLTMVLLCGVPSLRETDTTWSTPDVFDPWDPILLMQRGTDSSCDDLLVPSNIAWMVGKAQFLMK